MVASVQIRKPENWQDFEKLCKKLWGEIWKCSDTIQRNGRNGQNQHGVDVYGIPQGLNVYYGIQCKGKDEYTHSQLTEKEIDREIAKAKTFEPPLKRFVFATTANKDAAIETYIRKKNIESLEEGSFEICISCWEDIVDLLEEQRNTYNWYINNCQYKDSSDVSVTIEGEMEYTIRPQYYRTTKIYKHSPANPYITLNSRMIPPPIINPPSKEDYSWIYVYIRVQNIGNTVISDYKLYLNFVDTNIEDTSDLFHLPMNWGMNDAARTTLWNRIIQNREVIKYSDCCDFVIIPTEKILVQTDSRSFKIGLKPKSNAEKIELQWDFTSRDYNKEGTIVIKVEPIYEEREQIILQEPYEILKAPEIVIEPKIIEKE